MRSIWIIGALLSTLSAFCQPSLQFTALDSTFEKPLGLVSRGDSSHYIYILEKDGGVLRYNTTTQVKDSFLDLTQRVITTGEAGILGAAFHPDLDSNYFYILYTVPGSTSAFPVTTTLSRYTLTHTGLADVQSERLLLTIDKPTVSQSGGGVAFGPDGYLYLGIGDGGGRFDVYENGQNPAVMLGKILRIDVDRTTAAKAYSIPPDNPFVGSQDTLDEIWSLGVRNPFRFSFDAHSGDFWISDKANSYWQEINFQAAGNSGGQNYGWNCREGFEQSTPSSPRFCGSDTIAYDDPLLVYGREGKRGFRGGSVTGGVVYHGPEEALRGYYIFGDFFARRLFLYRPGDDPVDSVKVVPEVPYLNLTSFGTGNDGSLFAVAYGGTIYRIGIATADTVSDTIPTDVFSHQSLSLAVYPNPTTGKIKVTLPPAPGGPLQAYLIDARGRRILSRIERSFGAYDLDLAHLPAGIYTLCLMGRQSSATARIVLLDH